MKRILVFALAFALTPPRAIAQPVKANAPAPNFAVKSLAGKTLRLSDFKGKVVILDFGATECPPCRLEMPVLEGWKKKYKSGGLEVLCLLEMNPKPREARKMAKERRLTFPVAIDVKEKIGKRYGLEAHPTTFLIGRDGKVVKSETGYVKGDEKAMESAFLPLLAPSTKRGVKR